MKKRIASILLAAFLLCNMLPVAFAANEETTNAADVLYDLGLFRGVGWNDDGTPNYALDRTLTRQEAVVMLVRLLGQEEAALAGTWDMPFTDVSAWAEPCLGYAYANGLANGTAVPGFFDAKGTASATEYITLVLRALGYTSGADFKWNAAWELSDHIGLTNGEYNAENNKSFTRADVAILSLAAMEICLKDSDQKLWEKLVKEGVFTEELYASVTVNRVNLNTEPAEGCGSYLAAFNIPTQFGVAQYSAEEIRAMKNFTEEELQAAISTVADMLQYIVENDYGDESLIRGDLTFKYGGYRWSVNKSPEGALLSQSDSCGAVANLARYILEDDYDEEGYVRWQDRFTDNGSGGGHIFNYFKQGESILTFDFSTQISDVGPSNRAMWVVDDFADIPPLVLDLTKKQPTRVFVAVYLERDVHRDHAPVASISLKSGKHVAFIDVTYQDKIDLLYFNEEWLKGEGGKWYEYHPFFEDVGMSEARVPQKLVDSARTTSY